MLEQTVEILCPYCSADNSIRIDKTAGSQTYVEDCHVCCQPIVINYTLAANGDVESLQAHAENR